MAVEAFENGSEAGGNAVDFGLLLGVPAGDDEDCDGDAPLMKGLFRNEPDILAEFHPRR